MQCNATYLYLFTYVTPLPSQITIFEVTSFEAIGKSREAICKRWPKKPCNPQLLIYAIGRIYKVGVRGLTKTGLRKCILCTWSMSKILQNSVPRNPGEGPKIEMILSNFVNWTAHNKSIIPSIICFFAATTKRKPRRYAGFFEATMVKYSSLGVTILDFLSGSQKRPWRRDFGKCHEILH